MTHPVLAQLLAIAMIGALVALAIVVIPVGRRGAPISTRPGRRRDEAGWHGFIYVNPDDPNVIVPKRLGLGWTINFGHRRVWQAVVGALAFLTVTVIIGTLAGADGHH